MKERVASTDGTEAEAATQWLDWATRHVDRTDPLDGALAMPPDPEPTPDALKPFLGRWIPYGPNGH